VFEKWVALDYPRLSKTKGAYNLLRIAPDELMLTISVLLANGADDAWVHREWTPVTLAEYTLFLRPAPAGETEPPYEAQMTEIILGEQVTAVFMNDSDGRVELPIMA
jgi:hypothetical protein